MLVITLIIFLFDRKSNEGKVKSFDKPLEDFLAICNQVERHLVCFPVKVILKKSSNH